MKNLLESRRFGVLVFNTVVSIALYFGAHYLGPEAFEDVKFLIAALQPVALMLIYGYTKEDTALLNS